MANYRAVGIVDDVPNCECCGTRIRKAVMLAELDADGNTDDMVYFGTTCAAKVLGWTAYRTAGIARAAERNYQQRLAYARSVIAIYAPVEHGQGLEWTKALAGVFYGRNPGLRCQGYNAKVEVAKLLASARAVLAERGLAE